MENERWYSHSHKRYGDKSHKELYQDDLQKQWDLETSVSEILPSRIAQKKILKALNMKIVFKTILFYTTILVVLLFVASVDSLFDNGYFLVSAGIVASFIYACYKTLSKEDIDNITHSK